MLHPGKFGGGAVTKIRRKKMKIIKKIAAIMLSVMMVLGMCSVVGAEEASGSYEDDNGKITIQNAKKNQTYTIYRILKRDGMISLLIHLSILQEIV